MIRYIQILKRTHFLRGLLRFPKRAWRLGLGTAIRLFNIQVIQPFLYRELYPRLAKRYASKQGRVTQKAVEKTLREWQNRLGHARILPATRSVVSIANIVQNEQQLRDLQSLCEQSGETILADIDQDGYFLPKGIGPLQLPCVPEAEFMPRKRFLLSLVALGERVGVRKDFRGDQVSFLRELTVLYHLNAAGCQVPELLAVDFANMTITISFIRGEVLRKLLVDCGGYIEDRAVTEEEMLLPPDELEDKRLALAKMHLHEVFSRDAADDVLRQIRKAHKARIVLQDIKYGNILIEKAAKKSYLIDFDFARHYPCALQPVFNLLADQDIAKFNQVFDRAIPTFDRIDSTIKSYDSNVYAPAYIGKGLHLGKLENTHVGWGKWHFITKRALGNVKGKRILDLGANNASIGLQALRAGGAEVMGIERDQKFIEQGKFLLRAAAWADCRSYNFRYVQMDMTGIIDAGLGRFDIAMALCSLYYLDEADMARTVQFLSACCSRLVLQCNHQADISRDDAETYRKARIEFAESLLKENGFSRVRVIAPRGYERPIAVGCVDGKSL